jgi:hypothetical protein
MRAIPVRLGVATNCHHNGDMADWQRLAQLVTARRVELGHRRREDLIAATNGISLRTLGSIETASQVGYHRNTIAVLENALRWAPGSIKAIIDGGNPTPTAVGQVATSAPALTATATLAVGDNLTDDPVMRILNSPASPEEKERIVKQLLAEQREFAQRRVDELLREALERQ